MKNDGKEIFFLQHSNYLSNTPKLRKEISNFYLRDLPFFCTINKTKNLYNFSHLFKENRPTNDYSFWKSKKFNYNSSERKYLKENRNFKIQKSDEMIRKNQIRKKTIFDLNLRSSFNAQLEKKRVTPIFLNNSYYDSLKNSLTKSQKFNFAKEESNFSMNENSNVKKLLNYMKEREKSIETLKKITIMINNLFEKCPVSLLISRLISEIQKVRLSTLKAIEFLLNFHQIKENSEYESNWSNFNLNYFNQIKNDCKFLLSIDNKFGKFYHENDPFFLLAYRIIRKSSPSPRWKKYQRKSGEKTYLLYSPSFYSKIKLPLELNLSPSIQKCISFINFYQKRHIGSVDITKIKRYENLNLNSKSGIEKQTKFPTVKEYFYSFKKKNNEKNFVKALGNIGENTFIHKILSYPKFLTIQNKLEKKDPNLNVSIVQNKSTLNSTIKRIKCPFKLIHNISPKEIKEGNKKMESSSEICFHPLNYSSSKIDLFLEDYYEKIDSSFKDAFCSPFDLPLIVSRSQGQFWMKIEENNQFKGIIVFSLEL